MTNKNKAFLRPSAVAIFCFALIITSCTSTKELTYFQDLPESTVIDLPPMPQVERVIENGDELFISFSAKDNEAASYFNKVAGSNPISTEAVQKTTAGSSIGKGASSANYLVDNDGYLEFPIMGKVKVTGLTDKQLKENLTKSVGAYLKDPLVDVRFNTFRVSFIGEVKGTFILPMQRTTILQALAAAGDLPNTASRKDVELFRDYNGQRKIIKIDLRQKEVLTNPEVFQLRHNDVLYVKPRSSALFKENTSLVTSIVSIAIGIITLGFAISNHN